MHSLLPENFSQFITHIPDYCGHKHPFYGSTTNFEIAYDSTEGQLAHGRGLSLLI